jgi:uncharacterized protein
MIDATTTGRLGPWRGLLAALLGLLALSVPAAAQIFPALTGHVVDEAGVLDAGARQALATKLAALEAKTSDQVVVVTVRSLEGYTVEDYANRLFRQWRLGQSTTNNGVLLLVAPKDHKVRIEVGYGLEGTLPDAVAKLIIEERMVSHLRANQFASAVSKAVDSIVDVLTGDAAEWQKRAASRPRGHDAHVIDLPPAVGFPIVLLFGGVFLVFFGVIGLLVFAVIVRVLIAIHLLPQFKERQGRWHWLDRFDDGKPVVHGSHSRAAWASGSSSSWSDSSSSSSDSYSGGGGSSGGGGASGSW